MKKGKAGYPDKGGRDKRGLPSKKAVCFALFTAAGVFLCSCTAGAPLSILREAPSISRTVSSLPSPSADGLVVFSCKDTVIDASHSEDGYIMADYRGDSDRQKLQIVYPDRSVYLYALHGGYEVFPLTGGSGGYTISALQNIADDSYTAELTAGIDVVLKDPLSPFLLPNRYVDYSGESLCAREAERLAGQSLSTPESIDAIYRYVTRSIVYDSDKAATVDETYCPEADRTLQSGKGICFDYASLLCAMLRSRQIPSMLVTGYSGPSYHAWVRVYSPESGLLDGCIALKKGWNLLDPSYAASHTPEETLLKLGRTSSYVPEYYY